MEEGVTLSSLHYPVLCNKTHTVLTIYSLKIMGVRNWGQPQLRWCTDFHMALLSGLRHAFWITGQAERKQWVPDSVSHTSVSEWPEGWYFLCVLSKEPAKTSYARSNL